ncbi:beta-N-acetylglucosaminidase domain-containing protein, partial [Leifsonia sp. SIMBA_070]|uniref:beta-N-acetylglucosaminidase domain-containing protein n=1 Tax=Leifsonia sp. SIMBA_070 TaxID=3085810 RepID=UPI00397A5305
SAQALASLQAGVVNEVQAWLDTKTGARPLLVVPTEYFGTQTSQYRTRLAQQVTPKATMFWSGREVISPTIPLGDLTAAKSA